MKKQFFDYTNPAVINFVHASSEEDLIQRLRTQAFHFYHLDGTHIVDKESLFVEFSTQILKDTHTNNWSGFEDYLWQLLFKGEHDQTALIWTSTHNMLGYGLSDLIVCSDILTSVSRQRYAQRLMHLNFLLGEGDNFLPLER